MSKAELLANLYSANGPIGGGTAGGLLYLDGSKTLTTGSALQFDGTNLGLGGNLTFTGTAPRITGDFSNATLASRLMFQSSTTNGTTSFGVIPNGTGANSAYNAFASSDPTNTSFAQLRVGTDTSDVRLTSGITGTGTYLPMAFWAGGSERVRIGTSGNVGIGTSSTSSNRLVVFTSNANNTDGILVRGGATTANVLIRPSMSAGANNGIVQAGDSGIIFDKNAENTGAFVIAPWASTTCGIRMDNAGNVGIGTSSPATLLTVYKVTAASNPIGSTSNSALRLQTDASEFNEKAEIQFQAGTVAANTGEVIAAISSLYTTYNAANDGGGALLFSTRQSTATGGLRERARIAQDGTLTLRAGGSANITHVFNFNENGGEIQLMNASGTADILFDSLSGTGRLLTFNGGLQIGTIGAHALSFNTSDIERARIDSSGNLLVTGGGGLGYGYGSGGYVEQATSKTTAVTLNKPTGRIRVHNSTLGAGATASFRINNSFIGKSDVVLFSDTFDPIYSGSPWQYDHTVSFVDSGYVDISIKNIDTSSRSEYLWLNFIVIKGSAS